MQAKMELSGRYWLALALAVCAGGDIVTPGPGAAIDMVTEGIWGADFSNMYHLDYTPGKTTMRLRATCSIFETGVEFECDLPHQNRSLLAPTGIVQGIAVVKSVSIDNGQHNLSQPLAALGASRAV